MIKLNYQQLIRQLKRHEAPGGIAVLKPYKDSVGKWTIGFGRNLDDVGLRSSQEAEMLLLSDVRHVLAALKRYLPWYEKLGSPRAEVIINMAFNMGVGTLLTFHRFLIALKRYIETNDEHFLLEAGREMEDSKWWGQVGSRAVELREQLITGKWRGESA